MSAGPNSLDFRAITRASLSRPPVPAAPTAHPPIPPFTVVRTEKVSRDEDFYAWLLSQANDLRVRKPTFLDWAELAEELDEVVALARKETVSRMRTVLVHLLKWKYQTTNRGEPGWANTLVRERLELSLLLESKNLRNYLAEEGYALAYRGARTEAGTQMQLNPTTWERLFPSVCEWESNDALNVEFFPPVVADSNGDLR